MKRFTFLVVLFATVLGSFSAFAYQLEPTTLIFVRHAEKADDGTRNPPLNEKGMERAKNLATVLSEGYDLAAIYSTPYLRTELTAAPTAESLELEIQSYGFDDPNGFLSGLISENRGKAVLIVGHSNTTPNFMNRVLGEEKYSQFDEKAYGDLYVITTTEFGSGTVKVLEF